MQSEMLRTRDFRAFMLAPMTGTAARNKGMALFPRMVGGRYAMIGRQDGENLFLIRSDRIDHWDEGELLLAPKYPWEMVQIGNCGAPIELDEGWLLLTHGVGAMRSEEHTSELQSLMRISYAVFCLKKKNKQSKHLEKHN